MRWREGLGRTGPVTHPGRTRSRYQPGRSCLLRRLAWCWLSQCRVVIWPQTIMESGNAATTLERVRSPHGRESVHPGGRGNERTPRAPARARLPLLPFGPGGVHRMTPRGEPETSLREPRALCRIAPDPHSAGARQVRDLMMVLHARAHRGGPSRRSDCRRGVSDRPPMTTAVLNLLTCARARAGAPALGPLDARRTSRRPDAHDSAFARRFR